MAIQCLVGEDKNFVTEPMLHGKPMQFSQHRDNFKKIWSNLRLLDIFLGAVSIRKTVLPGMAIPMLKIRRPNGRLIFNMEIAIRR